MSSFNIDPVNHILIINVSKERDELTDPAFELFFKLYIFYKLSHIYKEEESLRILEDFSIKITPNAGELFTQAFHQYLAIQKRADRFYHKPFSEIYHLELFPFHKLAPEDPTFIDRLRKIMLKKLTIEDLAAWLKGARPEFYQEPKKYAIAIYRGTEAARRIYLSISIGTFYYWYSGVVARKTTEFSKRHADSTYHLNQILQMSNNELNPVLLFTGGFIDTFTFEPDPTYQINV